ncbi:MAG: radical SAM protein, partial [Anaerolineaceae bacterium]|nr:radical SAM protein [Anaerolineaceae bacterium]
RPPLLVTRNTLQGPITPPIGLASLAASLIQAGHQVTMVDALGEAPREVTPLFNDTVLATGLIIPAIVERIPRTTDMIGVSAMFSQEWPYVRKLIEAIKITSPSAPIIGGGEHFTALPEFALRSCQDIDCCALGEGEEILIEAAERVQSGESMSDVGGLVFRDNGRITRNLPRQRIRQIDEIPWPAWDLAPIEQYLDHGLGYGVDRGRSMPIVATRGCPYECTFCSNPLMWTTRWLARKPELVLDEIGTYINKYDVTNIDFYDLTAIIKKDWIVAFCELILSRGLQFTWQLPSGTRSEAIDDEVAALLHAAGCRNLTYAPESGSPRILRRIKKRVDPDRMLHSMRGAVRNRLNIKTNTMIGFPDETRREVWETILYSLKMAWVGVHDTSISMFSPYPGSELFTELCERNKIRLNDEYFLSLASYTDITKTATWANNLSSAELGFLRLLGLAAFYGTQYLLRPWRLIGTLVNLLSDREESRLDKSLRDYIARSHKKQGGPHTLGS